VKELNLGVRFLLELCLLAALAYAGLQVNVALAVAAPLVAAVVWGVFVSPKARIPLPTDAWLAVQVILFGAAVVGLVLAGNALLGVLLAIAVAVNLALVLFWGRPDTVT
jgi:hypothetical protein